MLSLPAMLLVTQTNPVQNGRGLHKGLTPGDGGSLGSLGSWLWQCVLWPPLIHLPSYTHLLPWPSLQYLESHHLSQVQVWMRLLGCIFSGIIT